MSDRPVWVVVLSSDAPWAPPWWNEERRFTDRVEALREAKHASQNPQIAVRVIEPSGEEWSL